MVSRKEIITAAESPIKSFPNVEADRTWLESGNNFLIAKAKAQSNIAWNEKTTLSYLPSNSNI